MSRGHYRYVKKYLTIIETYWLFFYYVINITFFFVRSFYVNVRESCQTFCLNYHINKIFMIRRLVENFVDTSKSCIESKTFVVLKIEYGSKSKGNITPASRKFKCQLELIRLTSF